LRSDPRISLDIGTEALYREFGAGDDPEALEGLLDVERRLRELGFDAEPAPAEPGGTDTSLGRFENQDLIGRGGQSLVFRAVDPRLDREVAIKVHSSFGTDGMLGLRRLVHEARALAHLDLPGVVRIFDAYEEDGRAFVVMESVDGPPLSELIGMLAGDTQPGSDVTRELALALEPIEARCRLVRDLARSLFSVHERGVIHRDVKPANVLVESGPTPKWIDFGLSHKDGTETELTSAFLIGTPAYISPEQVANRRTGASALSDQFSLGVLFYELLTLRNPFKEESRDETLDAIAQCAPPPPRGLNPQIPREVERIVLHMLEPVPQRRYDDAAAVADDLDAFLDHRPISIGAPTVAERLTKFVRRNGREVRLGAGAAGLTAVLTLLLSASNAYTTKLEQGERLRAILDGLTLEATRPEAYGAFEELDELNRDVQREGRSWLAALTPGDVPITAGLHEASERLARIIHAEEATFAAEQMEFPASDWQLVLDLERELCPECTANARFRGIGAVRHPSELEGSSLRRMAHTPMAPFPKLLESARARRMTPGSYRAELRSPSGRLEREHVFITGPDCPRVDVLSKRPSRAARERCIRLSFGGLAGVARWATENEWEQRPIEEWREFVPSDDFWIMSRPVTWREVQRVYGTPLPTRIQRDLLNAGHQPSRTKAVPEDVLDTPAAVSPIVAYEYASLLGMRLPTGLELVYALDTRRADERFSFVEKELTSWPARIKGETLFVQRPRESAEPSQDPDRSETSESRGILHPYKCSSVNNDCTFPGLAFRLASSVHPEGRASRGDPNSSRSTSDHPGKE